MAEWAALEALRVNRRLRDWLTLIDSVLETNAWPEGKTTARKRQRH